MQDSKIQRRIDKANLLALNEVFSTARDALSGQVLAVMFMAFIMQSYMPLLWAVLWLFVQMINFALRYTLMQKYKNIEDTIHTYDDAKSWLRYYMLSIILTGILWGLSATYVEPIPKEFHYLIYAVVVGLSFAAITTLGFVKEIYMAFVIPMLSILFLSFIVYDDTTSQLAAVFILIAYVYAHVAVVKFEKNFKISVIEKEIAQDAQEALEQEREKYNYQAHHDSLTGLPNRALFIDRLEQGMKKSKRDGSKLALFYLDLDHFKEINDTLGHKTGDEILINVSTRLKNVMRQGDTIARLGGDEFTVIMQDLKAQEDAEVLAKKIIDALKEVIVIENNALHITTSIGISFYPKDADTIEALLNLSDDAMYGAKSSGRNTFKFHS